MLRIKSSHLRAVSLAVLLVFTAASVTACSSTGSFYGGADYGRH